MRLRKYYRPERRNHPVTWRSITGEERDRKGQQSFTEDEASWQAIAGRTQINCI